MSNILEIPINVYCINALTEWKKEEVSCTLTRGTKRVAAVCGYAGCGIFALVEGVARLVFAGMCCTGALIPCLRERALQVSKLALGSAVFSLLSCGFSFLLAGSTIVYPQ